MRNEMGNNNVVAGPKANAEEDSTGIGDRQNPHIEEENEVDSKEENRVVSEDNTKDFHQQIEGSSSDIACRNEDPLADKKMLDLTEEDESKAVLKLSSDSGDIPTISDDDNNQESTKQAREDIELYNAISTTKEHENGEARVENEESPSIHPEEEQLLLETVAAEDTELLGNKMDEKHKKVKCLVHDNDSENKDIDLLGDKIDEKTKNGKCLAHETDSEVIETISENKENKDCGLSGDEIASQIENKSFGNGIEDVDIGDKDIQVEDNNNSANMIGECSGLEEISIITPKIETVTTKLTATVKEERKVETELPIAEYHETGNIFLVSVPSSPQLNSQDEKQDFENGSKMSIATKHCAGSELVSLKSQDSVSKNKELQTLDSTIGVFKVLETETISRRVSTGSIQEKPSFNPELRKSPSFIFDLPLESKFSESDQTPLLFLNKAICRSISSPSPHEPISVLEKKIQVERSDSDKLNGSFLNSSNDEGKDNFSKQDCETGSKENALTKGSGKRKPRASMFTTCICCAAAIS